MTSAVSTPRFTKRTWIFLAIGLAGGAVYSMIDEVLDDLSVHGGLIGTLAGLHEIIDHVLPIVAGALLGLGVHFLKLRSELAAAAVQSAGELRTKLQKVERDQAAWVVAAATLHEVRNPLHTLGLLVDDIVHARDLEPEARECLAERARAQMDRISAHLTKLRSVVTGADPEISPVDLRLVASDVARELSPLAHQERVELSVRGDGRVLARADQEYVRIILENLIGNGLDVLRSRGSGKIDVEVESIEDRAIVRVKDDGPGIDPDIRDALFEPLRSTKERGLGLGLSVGRALARSMHGDLTLEQGVSAGTVLCLALPGVS